MLFVSLTVMFLGLREVFGIWVIMYGKHPRYIISKELHSYAKGIFGTIVAKIVY